MSQQETGIQHTKEQTRPMGDGQEGNGRLIPTRRSVELLLCLLFVPLAVSSARAQVASHSGGYTPAFDTSAAFQPVGRPVARVNGAVLTDRDLLREMYSIFPYARVHNGFPKAMEADIRAGALNMIIFEELVYQEARHRNLTVPAKQMAQAVDEFHKQFQSPQEYRQFVQAEFKGSEQLLRTKIERSLLIDKLLKQEVTDKAGISAAEVRAYYDQHPESFTLPESFTFQSISFLPLPKANPSQLQEVSKRAANALRQAQATRSYEEFGALAEKISEDDFRVMMGDHKASDRAKLPPAVVTALLAMPPGQVSKLIEFAPNAFTIVRLNAHTPAGMQSFEAVKDGLREQLAKQKNEQVRKALDAKLSKNAKIEKV